MKHKDGVEGWSCSVVHAIKMVKQGLSQKDGVVPQFMQ